MKRSGFTMVELIFVIVIIGILAATALPKFKDVSTNANIANFTKLIGDIESSAVSSYTNETQLVGTKDVNLSDILTINGKGWDTTNGDTYTLGAGVSGYDYNDSINEIIATIRLCNGSTGSLCGSDANLTIYMEFGTTKVAQALSERFTGDTDGDSNKTTVYKLD